MEHMCEGRIVYRDLAGKPERDHCQLKWPCASTFSVNDNRIPSICLTKLCGPVVRKCAFLSGRFQFQSQGLAMLIEVHCGFSHCLQANVGQYLLLSHVLLSMFN